MWHFPAFVVIKLQFKNTVCRLGAILDLFIAAILREFELDANSVGFLKKQKSDNKAETTACLHVLFELVHVPTPPR